MLRINCLFALYLLSFATLVVARPIPPHSILPSQSSTPFQRRAWHQSLSQYTGLDKTKLGDLSQLSGQLSKYNPFAKKPKPLPAPDNRVNKPKGLGGTESNPHYLPEKPVNAGNLDNHSGLQKSFGTQLTWRQKLAQLKSGKPVDTRTYSFRHGDNGAVHVTTTWSNGKVEEKKYLNFHSEAKEIKHGTWKGHKRR